MDVNAEKKELGQTAVSKLYRFTVSSKITVVKGFFFFFCHVEDSSGRHGGRPNTAHHKDVRFFNASEEQ